MANGWTHTDDQAKTGEDYRAVADERTQTLKSFWKRFAMSGLFVLAVVAVLLACLAWFASNNRVLATSAGLSAQADRYAVTVTGAAANDQVGYYERAERTDEEKKELAGLDTSDSMVVTLGSNLNNDTAGSIYPGARGQIALTVTPIASDLNDVTLTLSRVLKMKDGSTSNTATDSTAAGLVEGHVLFFTGKDTNGFYSGRVVDGTITIPRAQFCKDGSTATTEPVPVAIYWVWPEYFQNCVLTDHTNYYENLFALPTDADYLSLHESMNAPETKTKYFYGVAGGVSAANAPEVSASMSSAAMDTCTTLYNNADEYIGKTVQYIQLRITSEEKIASQEDEGQQGGGQQ